MQVEDIVFEPILWTYKALENGEFSIYLRLTFYKDVKYLGTGFSTSNENWDSEKNSPQKSHPQYSSVISKINNLIDDVKFEIKLAGSEGRDITLQEIKQKIKNKKKVAIEKTAPSKLKLYEWYDVLIKNLEEAGKPGPADILSSSKANLMKVFEKDKLFNAFTVDDFEAYEKYLTTNIKTESTYSFYLRTFYGVWNKAIKKGYCHKDHHPKNHIQFQAYKKIKTKKRAVSADYIQSIEKLTYEPNTRHFRSQKYFLFSYYSRGMNFTDMALLKHKKNIEGADISYRRSKNKRDYDFKLHPKALAIIALFRNYPMQSDAGYVFPILNSTHSTARKIDQRIESALKDLNEDLKDMAKDIGLERTLTSYVARHSFATNLRSKDVDVKIIQEALGHETETQTTTYLAEIDDSIIASSIENALT
ncbi:phage integrase SAM-like domain-containing protein [Mucilaginibacter paludis]|uniref:Integrase family protein n=1 Tax=Mucilaginibacter paludis DSM 18603 TaxID=714943 RepID=H1YDY3_9SPHI|nr:phage integrase SAM-like domain-containing protein [Mucilaginibacter paludis]EHQ24323.1 integrase family protein [Mucilaginibacter paludis DSM 18603]